MSNIDEKTTQDISGNDFDKTMNNIERWTGFWRQEEVIIPLWISKMGDERMTIDDMKCLGAPIPSVNDERIYKEWCIKEGVKYLPPL